MFNGVVSAVRSLPTSLLAFTVLVLALPLQAQTSQAVPMITQPVNNAARVTLQGTVHPLAKAEFDRGAVEPSLQAPRMQLMLKRPADREAALRQFLTDVHTKGTASYHKWLTPDDFGKKFGPADSDVQQVVAWLQSQGMIVNKVSRGKSLIEFGGTAAQVQSAFGTAIHKYVVNGETHYANSSAIQAGSTQQLPAEVAGQVPGLDVLYALLAQGDTAVELSDQRRRRVLRGWAGRFCG